MREIALVTCVHFEWLATGRGTMALSNEIRLDSIPAAHALLVEDALELRLLTAFRDSPPHSQVPLVEIAEQLTAQRIGNGRERPAPWDPNQRHVPRVGMQSGHRSGPAKLG